MLKAIPITVLKRPIVPILPTSVVQIFPLYFPVTDFSQKDSTEPTNGTFQPKVGFFVCLYPRQIGPLIMLS